MCIFLPCPRSFSYNFATLGFILDCPFPSPSLELCDGEDGDEKELEKYLLVNCSVLSRVMIGIGTGMMQLMMMVIVPIKSKKNLLLNSAKVVRVVMQDTWEESGQAAMWRRGDNVFGQSSQT